MSDQLTLFESHRIESSTLGFGGTIDHVANRPARDLTLGEELVLVVRARVRDVGFKEDNDETATRREKVEILEAYEVVANADQVIADLREETAAAAQARMGAGAAA